MQINNMQLIYPDFHSVIFLVLQNILTNSNLFLFTLNTTLEH